MVSGERVEGSGDRVGPCVKDWLPLGDEDTVDWQAP
jgi:hypothetical protein